MDLLGLKVDSPAAGEREEESFRDDLAKGVWNRFLSLLLHGHARGEGADFKRVGARKLVRSGEGHRLQHEVFQRLGDAVQWGWGGGFFG